MARSKVLASPDIALRLHELESPEVNASLSKLRKRFPKHSSTVAEIGALLDRALGERTLSSELLKSRRD